MSAAAALLLIAGAALVWPGPQRPAAIGVRGTPQGWAGWFVRSPLPRHSTRFLVAAAVIASAITALLAPWHVALSAGLLVGVAVWSWGRSRARRAESELAAHDVETLHALAAELRAGNDLLAALKAAATVADTPLCLSLHRAGHTLVMGGEAAASLERGTAPAAGQLAGLVRMSAARGIALADAVEVLADDATERADARRDIASLLAGPRATAALLTLLPVFGIVLGQSIGADPLGVLLHSTAGAIAMLAGSLLAAAGVLWTHAMVRSAEQ